MWLALRFPNWALDCREPTDERPTLVVATTARRQRVIAASRSAHSYGVRLGAGLADARMRPPDVLVIDRSRSAETAAMARLAGWAWRYSSQIHWAIADHDDRCARLILEIGASLRLFGGQRRLLGRLRHDLKALGYCHRAGIGDTPQAAIAFSRARRGRARASGLTALPLRCLELDAGTHATLVASGFQRAGELLALPPATLARRFGSGLLVYLEQLRGRRPHGLRLYQRPARYRTHHELIGVVENIRGLIFVLRRVFTELATFLRGADSAIQTLRLSLMHESHPATRIVLRLSSPSHDARHLERVAHERLERVALAAPVLGIELASDQLRRAEHRQQALWQHANQTGPDAWPYVLDRLRARLGHQAVSWLDAPADHRPEYATARRDTPPTLARAAIVDGDVRPRPLWLIEPPEPVAPQALGDMRWISGPERIESGWWHAGQRRDYYRAIDCYGRLLWLFRDLQDGNEARAYFLHGLFG